MVELTVPFPFFNGLYVCPLKGKHKDNKVTKNVEYLISLIFWIQPWSVGCPEIHPKITIEIFWRVCK